MISRKKSKHPQLRSSFEDKAKEFLEKKKLDFGYEKDRLVYSLNYVVDFSFVSRKTGNPVYVEYKGYFSPEDRRKMKAVRLANPELDIRFVFMKDNLLTKRRKMKYSDWCKRNGYPHYYVVGSGDEYLPKEWVKEMEKK